MRRSELADDGFDAYERFMLSYRHAYHAGGFADVLKHGVYAFTLASLVAAPKPIFVLDTHAGAGRYDLSDPMARKTGEASRGVSRLGKDVPDLLRAYRRCLDRAHPAYPGSPDIAWQLLRRHDRLELVELHPTDAAALRGDFAADPGTRVFRADGLAHLRRALPPRERCCLVLIDPSYEIKSDYETIPEALLQAWTRCRSATFILWYPVIERARSEAMLDVIAASGVETLYRLELCLLADGAARGMTGCGLVVINPPPALGPALQTALPWLSQTLGCTGPWRAGRMHPARTRPRRKA